MKREKIHAEYLVSLFNSVVKLIDNSKNTMNYLSEISGAFNAVKEIVEMSERCEFFTHGCCFSVGPDDDYFEVDLSNILAGVRRLGRACEAVDSEAFRKKVKAENSILSGFLPPENVPAVVEGGAMLTNAQNEAIELEAILGQLTSG